MAVSFYQVNKLVIKADLFSLKFQKFLLRMLNFLLGIFFFSPIQIIWNALFLSRLFPFSLSSELYRIDN